MAKWSQKLEDVVAPFLSATPSCKSVFYMKKNPNPTRSKLWDRGGSYAYYRKERGEVEAEGDTFASHPRVYSKSSPLSAMKGSKVRGQQRVWLCRTESGARKRTRESKGKDRREIEK